ncbi:hypothetical protein HQQ94_17905 [Shewanella sp. VB17]|uniref:hypothetical protein n=1 Tax=Shewanella sp. VB17 TaxID=2739432 RepID=UPI0015669A68|nr:hypothetical protein [Shewanella sp. VB17]NRD75056.1 hypothetical protein [Shewanella sp. VB17]
MSIKMVISADSVHFYGVTAKGENVFFVTKRGGVATFKSISACHDFIRKFLPAKKIEVVVDESVERL